MPSKCRQNAVKMPSKCRQNVVKIPSKYRQRRSNTVKIFKRSKTVAFIQVLPFKDDYFFRPDYIGLFDFMFAFGSVAVGLSRVTR